MKKAVFEINDSKSSFTVDKNGIVTISASEITVTPEPILTESARR